MSNKVFQFYLKCSELKILQERINNIYL
jgi:hypothetical protein